VNTAGVQTEWWFHRSGCRQWLQAVRNTISNEVLESFLPPENRG
jgi:heterotetrameric sarcosine oxidase delta subunit